MSHRPFDIEAIPVRWMEELYGPALADLYLDRPDLIPAREKAVLMDRFRAWARPARAPVRLRLLK